MKSFKRVAKQIMRFYARDYDRSWSSLERAPGVDVDVGWIAFTEEYEQSLLAVLPLRAKIAVITAGR